MMGFTALAHGADIPTGPTIDPVTFAAPGRALAIAQALAADEPTGGNPASIVAIVRAPDDEWAPACEECLRIVGSLHDCTGGTGPVRMLEAVLMFRGRVRP